MPMKSPETIVLLKSAPQLSSAANDIQSLIVARSFLEKKYQQHVSILRAVVKSSVARESGH